MSLDPFLWYGYRDLIDIKIPKSYLMLCLRHVHKDGCDLQAYLKSSLCKNIDDTLALEECHEELKTFAGALHDAIKRSTADEVQQRTAEIEERQRKARAEFIKLFPP